MSTYPCPPFSPSLVFTLTEKSFEIMKILVNFVKL